LYFFNHPLNIGTITIGFCIRGILIELGLIISVIPISNTVMDAVEREKLGIASGLSEEGRREELLS
jgi:hypothetical protein